MKHLLVFLLLSLVVTMSACNKEKVVSNSNLPANAWKFINLYYPTTELEKTILVKQNGSKKYKVLLVDTTTLNFSYEGNIQRIDGPTEIPSVFFNSSITWYIQTNYPGQYPIAWSLETSAQSVKLVNGISLLFDRSGGFVKIL